MLTLFNRSLHLEKTPRNDGFDTIRLYERSEVICLLVAENSHATTIQQIASLRKAPHKDG